jgi:hypothetical protein
MSRWISYSGGPVYLEELLFKPKHSLIDQSLAARSGATATNGDGARRRMVRDRRNARHGGPAQQLPPASP